MKDWGDLRRQLQMFVDARGISPGYYPYRCIPDFVLKNGRSYSAAESPHRRVKRCCFQRSYLLAKRKGSPWIYTEGFAISPLVGLAMPHAWLTRADQPGRAFEVAWESSENAEYLGIPFQFDYVRKVFWAGNCQYYGVLEAWWIHYPLMTGEQPLEEVIWKP
jgi:hypothetical protein